MIWQGPWSSITAYNLNDAVFFGGSTYIAIRANTNVQPDVSSTSWQVLAQQEAQNYAAWSGPVDSGLRR